MTTTTFLILAIWFVLRLARRGSPPSSRPYSVTQNGTQIYASQQKQLPGVGRYAQGIYAQGANAQGSSAQGSGFPR